MRKQKPGWLQGQPCLVSSETTGRAVKQTLTVLTSGLLLLSSCGREITGRGFFSSPDDPWKTTERKLVRERCLKQFQSQVFLNFHRKCSFLPGVVYAPVLPLLPSFPAISPIIEMEPWLLTWQLRVLCTNKLFPSTEKYNSRFPHSVAGSAVRAGNRKIIGKKQ